jgi:putative beta-barrel porin BBP2
MTHHRRLLVLMLLAASAGAQAADAQLTLHAGDTYTDNALRTEGGPSDNIGAVAMRLDLSAQSDHYEANLRTAATYFHYFQGTQDDDVLRGLAGDVTIFIVPERFTWKIQENYGPVLENPLSPDRPDNWTYDSYFSTGPDFQFGETTGFHAVLSGRYARSDYENKLVPSNQQYSGFLNLALGSDGRSERSLQLSAKRVEEEAVDQEPFPVPADGYDIQEAFLRWSSSMKRGSFYIDAGGTWLSNAGETTSAPLLRMGLDRTISRTLTLSLGLGTNYSENLRRFARLQNGSDDIDDPRGDVTLSTKPLRDEYVDATLQYQTARTTAALRVAYNQLEQQETDSPLKDQKYSEFGFAFHRQITPTFRLELGAMLETRDYGRIDRSDDDVLIDLTGGWLLDRNLEARLTGRLQKRDSSVPEANFTEKSVQLEFVYFAFRRDEPRRNKRILERELR